MSSATLFLAQYKVRTCKNIEVSVYNFVITSLIHDNNTSWLRGGVIKHTNYLTKLYKLGHPPRLVKIIHLPRMNLGDAH